MTNDTKELEKKFNKLFPTIISPAEPGASKPYRFNKEKFLKAAKALQKTVKDNDQLESSKYYDCK